ncbi:DUF1643 domain-containing protein [uncultured Methylobacterium sp.]|jgi:hypothetical protein|uniref:DUF1643 domain-containing protein n=1 Tax=uncultured Methylobacterium sp. TaxID=157278 RepID=UPI002635D61B|nr:DUF1643 domain-containing protein [uncultured Methylobacterium sp.]
MGEPRPTNAPVIHGSAEFSDCGEHRIRLDRWWSDEPRALVGMANPSKAGADRNDPTICTLNRLLYGRPGIGGYTVVNAEDRIATDPADLARWLRDMEMNDRAVLRTLRTLNINRIRELSAAASVRIVAWGNLLKGGLHAERVIRAMSLDGKRPLYAFGTTADGAPKHPMARGHHRIPLGQPLVEWRPASA